MKLSIKRNGTQILFFYNYMFLITTARTGNQRYIFSQKHGNKFNNEDTILKKNINNFIGW